MSLAPLVGLMFQRRRINYTQYQYHIFINYNKHMYSL